MSLLTCIHVLCFQSLVIPEKFQHILRVLNTNIDGRRKIAFAITAIKVRSSLNDTHVIGFKCTYSFILCDFRRRLNYSVNVFLQLIYLKFSSLTSRIGFTMPLTPLFVSSQGVGRRYAHVVLRKADIDLNKRAGELTDEEVRRTWRL